MKNLYLVITLSTLSLWLQNAHGNSNLINAENILYQHDISCSDSTYNLMQIRREKPSEALVLYEAQRRAGAGLAGGKDRGPYDLTYTAAERQNSTVEIASEDVIKIGRVSSLELEIGSLKAFEIPHKGMLKDALEDHEYFSRNYILYQVQEKVGRGVEASGIEYTVNGVISVGWSDKPVDCFLIKRKTDSQL